MGQNTYSLNPRAEPFVPSQNKKEIANISDSSNMISKDLLSFHYDMPYTIICKLFSMMFINLMISALLMMTLCNVFSDNANDTILFTQTLLSLISGLKLANPNRVVIGHININSLRNKFDDLKFLFQGNVDIMVITATKLDDSFPSSQFCIDGYSKPLR